MQVSDDLYTVKELIEELDLELSHYEIREDKDRAISTSYRAVGNNPLQVLDEWEDIDGEVDYVVEAFLENSLDRIIYDKEEGVSYLSFEDPKKSKEYQEKIDKILKNT